MLKMAGVKLHAFLTLTLNRTESSVRGTGRTQKNKNISFVAQQVALVADTAQLVPAKCEQLVGTRFRDRQHFSKPTGHYTYRKV